MSVVSEVAEAVVEEVLENAGIPDIWTCTLSKSQHLARYASIGVLAGAVGGAVAYAVLKKRIEAKYAEISEQEIAEARQFFTQLHKEGNFETPEKALETLRPEVAEAADAMRNYQGVETQEEREGDSDSKTEVDLNIFTQSQVDDDWDQESEEAERVEGEPYVISQQEFLRADPGYDQVQFTYYEGDQTLADDKDQEIPLVDEVVGEENLLRFGHGSGDVRMLYIRNDRLQSDFAIAKSDGKYAHEVLGFEHSDDSRFERMRRSRGEDG